MTARQRCSLGNIGAALCALIGASVTHAPLAVAQVVQTQQTTPNQQTAQTLQTTPVQQFPLSLRLGRSVTWDANVFRVPDSVTDPDINLGKTGRSDRFTTTTVGLNFEKLYSLQRFALSVAEVVTRYEKFDSLDRNAFNYRGEWQWQLTPRVGGVFGLDHAQTVIGFEDIARGQQQSQQTIDNRIATVDALLSGGWHLLGGASRTERRNSVAFQAVPDIEQTGTELGFRYVAESQNAIAFIARSRHGTFPNATVDTVNFIDDEFTVKEAELNGIWVLSQKSALTGRLSRIEYRYPNIPQRDFSGTSGDLQYTWTPTGKLTLIASARRTVLPWTPDTATSYRVENTFTLAPTWRISDKVNLRATAGRVETNYLGPVVPTSPPLRRDVLRTWQFGADWLPFRGVILGVNFQHLRRTSNQPVNDYNDNILGLNASLTF